MSVLHVLLAMGQFKPPFSLIHSFIFCANWLINQWMFFPAVLRSETTKHFSALFSPLITFLTSGLIIFLYRLLQITGSNWREKSL